MSTTLLRSFVVVLTATLGWAAITKVARPSRWAESLRGYAIPTRLNLPIVVLVPLVEGVLAGVFLTGRSRVAALGAATLLTIFSLAVLRARSVRGDGHLPCGCFGGRKARDYRVMLARNLLLLVFALAVLAGGRDVTLLPSDVTTADLIPLGLVIGGLGLGVWVVSQVPVDLDVERS